MPNADVLTPHAHHKEVLKLVPRKIRAGMALRHLGIDVVIWSSLILARLWTDTWPMNFALALGFAVICFRSFGMMHECVHTAAANSRRWNNALGAFYGVLCFLPFKSWQDLHLRHHMWTGNVEQDPSSRILFQFKKNNYRTAGYVARAWRFWVPVLAFLQHIVFWKAIKSRSEAIFVTASLTYLGLTAYILGPGTMIMGLVAYLYMVEIINFPHHLGMPQYEGEQRFATTDQAQFTRSCVYPKWFAHLVLLNFNLHTEHHLYPAHPWYALDQIHEHLGPRGMMINQCQSNKWILANRTKPIEEIMRQTFSGANRSTQDAVAQDPVKRVS